MARDAERDAAASIQEQRTLEKPLETRVCDQKYNPAAARNCLRSAALPSRRRSGDPVLAYLGRRNSSKDPSASESTSVMYDTGLDIEAIAKRLRATFTVDEILPFDIRLMLAHLHRAETTASR